MGRRVNFFERRSCPKSKIQTFRDAGETRPARVALLGRRYRTRAISHEERRSPAPKSQTGGKFGRFWATEKESARTPAEFRFVLERSGKGGANKKLRRMARLFPFPRLEPQNQGQNAFNQLG